MLKRYCTLTGRSFWRLARYDSVSPPYDMDWDFDNEIHYDTGEGKRCVALACVLILSITLTAFTVNDSFKPKHRGEELTISEFSENYNNTLVLLYDDPDATVELQSDGTWKSYSDRNIFSVDGRLRENFEYETDNDILCGITYNQHWPDVDIVTPISSDCMIAAVTLLLSQNQCGFWELLQFTRMWEQELLQPSGEFWYKNLQIQWNIDASPNLLKSNMMYFATDDVGGELNVSFRVALKDK